MSPSEENFPTDNWMPRGRHEADDDAHPETNLFFFPLILRSSAIVRELSSNTQKQAGTVSTYASRQSGRWVMTSMRANKLHFEFRSLTLLSIDWSTGTQATNAFYSSEVPLAKPEYTLEFKKTLGSRFTLPCIPKGRF